jgi:hypothetical protein
MDEFTIQGGSDYLKITFNEVYGFPDTTCHFGGYDTKSEIEIYSDGFKLNSALWISTGEIYEFYQQLLKANEVLNGATLLSSYEGNLECNLKYDVNGHIIINGMFSKQNEYSNKLSFNFKSDQSYIQSTLRQLEAIANKYGGMKGIK